MNNLVNTLFLKKYTDAGDQQRFQARALTFILLGLIVVTALIAVVLQNPKDQILVLSMAVVSGLLLLLLRAGHADLAGIIVITFLSILCVLLIFTTELRTFIMVYQLAFLQMFVLSMTLLITSRSIHAIIVTTIGVLAIVANHVVRAMPILINGDPATIDDPIIAGVLLLFAGLIVISSNRRGRIMYAAVERESHLNRAKAEHMEVLIADLQGDFDTGNQLVNSSNVLAEAVSDLTGKVETIHDRMNSVSDASLSLSESGSAMTAISQTVSKSSEEQTIVVEETSAAITQMASSIQQISRVAESRKAVVAGLARNASDAESVLSQSTRAMADLRGFIKSLTEVNRVISDIADRTGLLAMNAAIEAAHAGDSGRGFAVVAGEVRKLSENAVTNVKSIGDMLQEIGSSVERAVETNTSVTETFHSIRNTINDVVDGMDEILSGVGELAKGTSEINTGTAQSVMATQKVRENIVALHERIENISDSIDQQRKATDLVMATLGEAAGQLNIVDHESSTVRSVGEKNASNLRGLQARLVSGD